MTRARRAQIGSLEMLAMNDEIIADDPPHHARDRGERRRVDAAGPRLRTRSGPPASSMS